MSETEPERAALSPREAEVAAAYADGQSYKEIARALGLSPTTVRTHLRSVYRKLAVTTKVDLLRCLGDPAATGRSAETDSAALVAELALELDEAIRRERVLAQVLAIISHQGDRPDAVIAAVLHHALEICEAEFGILFAHQGQSRFRGMQSQGISPAFAGWLAARGWFAVAPGTGLGRVAADLQSVNIADVRGEEIYHSGDPLRIATADLGGARSFAGDHLERLARERLRRAARVRKHVQIW